MNFCVFSHPRPFTKPLFSLGKSKGWGACHPRNRKRPEIHQIPRNFMEFGEISINFIKIHDFQGKSCFWVPGSEYEHRNPCKSIGITYVLACPRCTMEFLQIPWKKRKTIKNNGNQEISWKSWNSMEFTFLLDSATLHETFVFLAQNQGLSGFKPQKPKNCWNSSIFLKSTKNSPFPA